MTLFRKLPKSMPGYLGPIAVKVVEDIKSLREEDCYGKYDFDTRTIQIGKIHPDAQRQVLWHEWIHSVIFDSGLHNMITKEQHEAVCDTIATALATHF